MSRRVVLIGVLLGMLALPFAAQGARTEYRGQLVCDDRGTWLPLGGVTVQLWRRGSPDFLPVEWVGGLAAQGFTNPDGTFSLTSDEGVDNHFVRMALRDANGVRLKDWSGINDWGTDFGGGRNDVPVREVGAWLFSSPGTSHQCAVWRGFHRAYQDFRAITGVTPPSGGVLVQWDGLNFGTPWAANTEVYWPGGYSVSYNAGEHDTAEHEFGHTVRHGYDGDSNHFFGDVVAYEYARSHSACSRTSPAYAFNEGWAEYWSGDYWPWPERECAAFPRDDYSVEGNVAAALANLETNCFLFPNRAAMVGVLRDNPGTIHSFQEFRDRLACTPFFTIIPPPPQEPQQQSVTVSGAQAAALAQAQVRDLDRQVRRLGVQLTRANRASAVQLACTTPPCNEALRRATRPAALRTRIALLRMVRQTIDDQDTVAEQSKLGQLTIAQLARRRSGIERLRRIAAARITGDGMRDTLTAGRRVFAQDRSRATRRLRTNLLRRLAATRRAQRQAGAVAGLALAPASLGTLRKTPPQVFTDPEPLPPPPVDPRPASTLTLTCPASSKPGVIGGFAGNLVPVIAGATVELRVTPPAGGENVHTVATAADGSFLTAIPMQAVGTWTVFARWTGNTNLRPDDSPPCQVAIA